MGLLCFGRVLFFIAVLLLPLMAEANAGYAVARTAVPVFNSPQSAVSGAKHKPDRCGQVRELEFIALPGTVFRVVDTLSDNSSVMQVSTNEYTAPPGVRLYLAKESVALHQSEPVARKIPPVEKDRITGYLQKAKGLPYIWGGNFRSGVMSGSYHRFAGLDCSGLLYEATGGATPRNTAQLVGFGSAVPIEGLDIEKIAVNLLPLDLIVWKGHVIIVLDSQTAIESTLDCNNPGRGGVVTTPLKKRLAMLLKQRKPADKWPDSSEKEKTVFVVRRWL